MGEKLLYKCWMKTNKQNIVKCHENESSASNKEKINQAYKSSLCANKPRKEVGNHRRR